MWLRLAAGDTIHGALDFGSVQHVAKHWTGQRSVPCLSTGCPYCAQGSPVRWRYQAKVVVKSEVSDWEFGEEVMVQLQTITHQHHYAHVIITRFGQGRDTRYTVRADFGRPDPTTEVIARNLKYQQQGGPQCPDSPTLTRDTTSDTSPTTADASPAPAPTSQESRSASG